jgi:hypothetical protein
LARIRLPIVMRRNQNRPRLVVPQKCVKPRKSNVSGFGKHRQEGIAGRACVFARGARFAVDTDDGVAMLAELAPGSGVECRLALPSPSSVTPFGHKFGCAPADAARLLNRARRLGVPGAGSASTSALSNSIPARARLAYIVPQRFLTLLVISPH